MSRLWICLLILLPALGQVRPPYFDGRKQAPSYHGPGREDAEPSGVREVGIGYFGPADPQHPEAGAIWAGAALAIEEANREGGYRGLPFRLVPGWAENPWAAGASAVVRLAYRDRVWAIIGSIDGAATHLAEQVVVKARLTLINPAATDRSVHGINVPWMFSCAPGDHLQAPVLVEALGGRPFVLLSATDHDSRAFVAKLKAAPSSHVEFQPGTHDVSALVRRVTEAQPGAVVVIAGARVSAQVVRALRRANFSDRILGGPAMGRRVFVEEAGAAAEGVLFPLLMEAPAGEGRLDYAAAHAYDAARLLVAAIRKAGLNRARIRDAVRELSPFHGLSGAIEWDTLGQNQRPVRLGTIRRGRVEPAGLRHAEAR